MSLFHSGADPEAIRTSGIIFDRGIPVYAEHSYIETQLYVYNAAESLRADGPSYY